MFFSCFSLPNLHIYTKTFEFKVHQPMDLNLILRIVTKEKHAEIRHFFTPLYICKNEIFGEKHDFIIR